MSKRRKRATINNSWTLSSYTYTDSRTFSSYTRLGKTYVAALIVRRSELIETYILTSPPLILLRFIQGESTKERGSERYAAIKQFYTQCLRFRRYFLSFLATSTVRFLWLVEITVEILRIEFRDAQRHFNSRLNIFVMLFSEPIIYVSIAFNIMHNPIRPLTHTRFALTVSTRRTASLGDLYRIWNYTGRNDRSRFRNISTNEIPPANTRQRNYVRWSDDRKGTENCWTRAKIMIVVIIVSFFFF